MPKRHSWSGLSWAQAGREAARGDPSSWGAADLAGGATIQAGNKGPVMQPGLHCRVLGASSFGVRELGVSKATERQVGGEAFVCG